MSTGDLLVTLEQRGFELYWVHLYLDSFHQLRSCITVPHSWGWLNWRIGRNHVCVQLAPMEGQLWVTCRFCRGWGPLVLVQGPNCTFIGLFNDFPLNLGKNPNSLIRPNKSWHLPTKCQGCSACHHCNKEKSHTLPHDS